MQQMVCDEWYRMPTNDLPTDVQFKMLCGANSPLLGKWFVDIR